MNRRNFLEGVGMGLAAVQLNSLVGCATETVPTVGAAGIGMCDWNLGPMCDPEQIPLAREAHLAGIQVSLGKDPDDLTLRDPAVRRRYLELGRQHDVSFHSVAIGLLNGTPLATDPRGAVWVIDAIETAAVLGSSNVLLAFFSRGDLRFRDDDGEFVNQSEGTFASYQLDEDKVTSVVNTLKQIMPRAQAAGVIVGLENTITARQSVEIIDRVGSEWLRVYYDVGNSTGNGYDVPGEIRMLENDMICEVHLKDWQTPILGSEDSQVDMAAAAAALRDIGYNKWLVLETSGREDNFLEDTRANVEFVNATFDMASAH
jgi:sugar phosphate isomerase/epimerase